MILTKKRTPDEPTEFRTIEYDGANIRLGPTGHEKMPKGDTIVDKVRSIVKRSIETNNDQHAKEVAFLTMMLGDVQPPASDAEETVRCASAVANHIACRPLRLRRHAARAAQASYSADYEGLERERVGRDGRNAGPPPH